MYVSTFVHFLCSLEGGSQQFITAGPLVPLCQGFCYIDEVAQVVGQLLEPLVFCFKSHAPDMGDWATPELFKDVHIYDSVVKHSVCAEFLRIA